MHDKYLRVALAVSRGASLGGKDGRNFWSTIFLDQNVSPVVHIILNPYGHDREAGCARNCARLKAAPCFDAILTLLRTSPKEQERAGKAYLVI
jgi:hypothetical protein